VTFKDGIAIVIGESCIVLDDKGKEVDVRNATILTSTCDGEDTDSSSDDDGGKLP